MSVPLCASLREMLSTSSYAFGPLRFPTSEGGGSSNAPSEKPLANYTERYNSYLKSLAQWAETARLNRKYTDAMNAAAEVLGELGFSSSKEILGVTAAEVSAKIPQSLRPAAGLALFVVSRESWTRSKELEHVPAEAAALRERTYKLLALACELDPSSSENQRAFQNIAFECRRSITDYQGASRAGPSKTDTADKPIDLLTQGALDSVKRFLTERFKLRLQTFDWISTRMSAEERETLSWALEQAATLAHARATSLVHRDIQRSAGYTGQALEFGLGCFRSLGLTTEPRKFKDVHPHALARQGTDQAHIKRIMRVARILSTAYLAQREFTARDAADNLAERAREAEGSAPQSSRHTPTITVLGERPTKPERSKTSGAEPPAETTVLPPKPTVPTSTRASNQPTPSNPPQANSPQGAATVSGAARTGYEGLLVPPAHSQPQAVSPSRSPATPISKSRAAITVNHKDWAALRKDIAESQPFTLGSVILNACTTQFTVGSGGKLEYAFKKHDLFPPIPFTEALKECALDLDILRRGGVAAANLFIEEYELLLSEMTRDPIALIRLQVTMSFIKTRNLVSDEKAEQFRGLATECNKAIVALELRRDHNTAQKVFGPIISAAIDGRLRP
jgi:hypothetical protein